MIIAQISDTHITDPGAKADLRFDTAGNLERAVQHLNGLPEPPDLVMVSGDCVDRGGVAEYERFRELLRPLTMPVFAIPGNHDDRVRLRQVFGAQGSQGMDEFVQFVVDVGPVRVIALDSNVPGQDGGRLCEARLGWLSDRLAEAPGRPTVIFLHHPPFSTGLRPLDDIGLEGSEALGAIVARSPHVERVAAGHVHLSAQRRFHGAIAVTCPSTAHQVILDLKRPERLSVAMSPPAALLHVWDGATGLVTHTSVIGSYGAAIEIHDGVRWV